LFKLIRLIRLFKLINLIKLINSTESRGPHVSRLPARKLIKSTESRGPASQAAYKLTVIGNMGKMSPLKGLWRFSPCLRDSAPPRITQPTHTARLSAA
jgi:hypothetical protein